MQATLRGMVGAGARAVVLEASSHALALDRVRGVSYDVAVWTNLTGEHLDFHGSMEQYFADKAKLVRRAAHSVLNVDDRPWFERLVPLATEGGRTCTTYSAEGNEADWRATDVQEGAAEITFTVHGPEGEMAARLPMIGRFNVANALAAMAGVVATGVPQRAVVEALSSFGGVAGFAYSAGSGRDGATVVAGGEDGVLVVNGRRRCHAVVEVWLEVLESVEGLAFFRWNR